MKAVPRLMGVETEYAFRAAGHGGRRLSQDPLVDRLVALAAETMPYLPECNGAGVFLSTGGRLYIDAGLHPEYATPECPSPAVAVRYVKAGHRILHRLAEMLVATTGAVKEAAVFAGNQDYSSGATWASHENYLHRSDQESLFAHLVPHLVTRVIYTGAGGFNPMGPGLEFNLSVREPHLRRVRSGNSTSARGIYHTKEEPHCGLGYGRLHVLAGDSLASEQAGCLRLGTTALIIALIEEGRAPGADLALRSPLMALHVISRDPTCRAQVFLLDGGLASALEIQRRYLERVEAALGEPFLPPWAEEICTLWRETLEALEEDPRRMAMTLDWAIKWEIFSERARRRGFDEKAIRTWNRVLRRARMPAGRVLGLLRGPPLAELPSPVAAAWRRLEELAPVLRKAGRDWEELEEFLKLRAELMELDTRFAQLGSGIFASLERRGVLKHRIRGVADVELAVTHPPLTGRARLRGDLIRRVAQDGGRYLCDWSGVMNRQERTILDLSDPFETQERWLSEAEYYSRRSSGRGSPAREGRRSQSLDDLVPPRIVREGLTRLRRELRAGGAQADPEERQTGSESAG